MWSTTVAATVSPSAKHITHRGCLRRNEARALRPRHPGADAAVERHDLDAVAGAQGRIGKNGGNDRCAMDWWVRIVGADQALELREDTTAFVARGGYDRQGADTLAVQRENLRE